MTRAGPISNKHSKINTARDFKCADSLRLHFVDVSAVQYSGHCLTGFGKIISKRE